MILKPYEPSTSDIDALGLLLKRPGLTADLRRKIELQIKQIRAGDRGEKETAYEVDFHWGAHDGRVILHNVRFEVGDKVAQIDHLMINRLMNVFVIESKSFADGISANEHGEFVSFWNGKPSGISSPIMQNERHIDVLKDLFRTRQVELPKRLGLSLMPVYQSIISVSKSARISRPKGVPGMDRIVKSDQIKPLADKDTESQGVLSAARMVSADTVIGLGQELLAAHRPHQTNWAARFGLLDTLPGAEAGRIAAPATASTTASEEYLCACCDIDIPIEVVRYCRKHSGRFKGNLLCREHQSSFR